MTDEMTVQELAVLKQAGNNPVILDVREGWERDICKVSGTLHIPLSELPGKAESLSTESRIIVMCHHGGRSARAVAWLRQHGYDAINLAGGIHAWAEEIDSGMAKY